MGATHLFVARSAGYRRVGASVRAGRRSAYLSIFTLGMLYQCTFCAALGCAMAHIGPDLLPAAEVQRACRWMVGCATRSSHQRFPSPDPSARRIPPASASLWHRSIWTPATVATNAKEDLWSKSPNWCALPAGLPIASRTKCGTILVPVRRSRSVHRWKATNSLSRETYWRGRHATSESL